MVEIRIGQERVFPDDVKPFQCPLMGRIHHLHNRQPRFFRQAVHAPGLGHLFPHRRICNFLVPRVDIGQPPHVAGALYVVLPPERVEPSPFHAHIAAKHGQVRQAFHIVRAADVLRNAHGVKDGGRLGACVQPGRGDQVLLGNAAHFFNVLRGVFFDGLLQIIQPHGAGGDIGFVVQPFLDDDVHHAVDPRHIGAQVLP